jgi:hypothetical protein
MLERHVRPLWRLMLIAIKDLAIGEYSLHAVRNCRCSRLGFSFCDGVHSRSAGGVTFGP